MKANSRFWFRTYGATVLESVPYTKLTLPARGLLFDLRALCSRIGFADVIMLEPTDIAHCLRLEEAEVVLALEELRKSGLVKRRQDGVEILGFMSEQEATTAAARMQKMRAKKAIRLADWKAKKRVNDTPSQ